MNFGKLFLLLSWVILGWQVCDAQQYNFQKYSLEEGLPQSQVRTMLQDRRGVIWLSTEIGGVCRFNGLEFELFRPEDNFFREVRKILEDSQGNLWFIGYNGVKIYDGRQLRFLGIAQGYLPVSDNQMIRAFEDKHNKGKIWIISIHIPQNRRSILYFEKGKFVNFNSQNPQLSEQDKHLDMFQDQSGDIFFTTSQGLFRYDGKDLKRFDNQYLSLISKHQISLVSEDSKHRLWLKTYDGEAYHVFVFEGNRLTEINLPINSPDLFYVNHFFEDSQHEIWILTAGAGFLKSNRNTFQHFTTQNGVSYDNFTDIIEDHEGNIWLATNGGGINKFEDRFINYGEKEGLKDLIIWSVLQDSRGGYWIGTHRQGIAFWNGSQFTHYLENANLDRVKRMIELNDGSFLLATYNGLWQYDRQNIRNVSEIYGIDPNTRLHDILKDGNKLWLSTFTHGAVMYDSQKTQYFDESTGLSSNFVFHVLKDRKGIYWFSTGNSISSYDGKRIINYTEKNKVKAIIHRQGAEDAAGNLWFATTEGLAYVIRNQKSFNIQYLGIKEGISSHIVYSVLADKQGNIWAGTQNGVDKITIGKNGRILNIQNFSTKEGFIGIENNTAANYTDRQGNLWFGTIKGVMKTNPESETSREYPPLAYLTRIKLFLQDIDWESKKYQKYHSGLKAWSQLPQDLVLPYAQNHLSFEFEGLNFKSSNKIRYQWKLHGVDVDWTPFSKQRQAVYANLSPGSYVFEIRAISSDGTMSQKSSTFSFEIQAPFWQTWWFSTLLLLAFVAVIYGGFRIRIQQLQAQKYRLEQLVDQKTAEIREQKDEILVQNEELSQQQEEILAQKDAIQEINQTLLRQNTMINKSIQAAKTIQEAILPFSERMKSTLQEYFVIYHPKDVVSGDFYWLQQIENKVFIAVADCTGHGVPGAFMSMIGSILLDKIIQVERIFEPNKILEDMHLQIKRALKQDSTHNNNGMDMALLVFEKISDGNYKVVFAGAKRPLLYVKPEVGRMEILKGDRKSIGGIQNEKLPFHNHEIILQEDSIIYLGTDGFEDQNDLKRRKFGEQKLIHLLEQNAFQDLHTQKNILENALSDHMTGTSQRDDILLIGFKLP
ncbi:MAG: two-component regulator propeller domain-containing protein [Microscillaceae bacterium]|nr:two-component regulator propeller domain-containing protein [Microscillaceae bacterium]